MTNQVLTERGQQIDLIATRKQQVYPRLSRVNALNYAAFDYEHGYRAKVVNGVIKVRKEQ